MQIFSRSNKIILLEMIRTDFKLRYQGSVLGYLWSLLRPLFVAAILYVVFAKFLGVKGDIRHYASYLLLGIMCWTFFTEVTTGAISSVVGKSDLIRKISIPRYLTVLSTSASALINFTLNMAVLFLIMLITGVEIQEKLVVLGPILLIEMYVFAISIAFILAAAYVKYRDVSFIWEVFTQMLFYLTPIIYPMQLILEKYPIGKYILVSPVAQIVQDLRYIFVTPQTSTSWAELRVVAVTPILIVFSGLIFSIWFCETILSLD